MSSPRRTVSLMNSTPAPRPMPDGTVPVPSEVAALDWSGDPVSAMVGRLVHEFAAVDRMIARAVDTLVRVVEAGATEATLGVADELVLSQTCRAVGFERRTLLAAATTLAVMPATRQATEQDRDERAVVDNRVVLQPRLDGSGGGWFDYDANHFTPFAQSIDNHAADSFPLQTAPDPGELAVCDLNGDAAGSGRPSLLVTCSLDTLLDGTVPGRVLTGMAGRMKATSDTIRWRVDTHGSDCRLIVMDDVGEVVGRRPPVTVRPRGARQPAAQSTATRPSSTQAGTAMVRALARPRHVRRRHSTTGTVMSATPPTTPPKTSLSSRGPGSSGHEPPKALQWPSNTVSPAMAAPTSMQAPPAMAVSTRAAVRAHTRRPRSRLVSGSSVGMSFPVVGVESHGPRRRRARLRGCSGRRRGGCRRGTSRIRPACCGRTTRRRRRPRKVSGSSCIASESGGASVGGA